MSKSRSPKTTSTGKAQVNSEKAKPVAQPSTPNSFQPSTPNPVQPSHVKKQDSPKPSLSKKPPSPTKHAWQQWPSLVLYMRNLPSATTVEQIRAWLQPQGKTVAVNIMQEDQKMTTKCAEVRFRPPPTHAFWNHIYFKTCPWETRTPPPPLFMSLRSPKKNALPRPTPSLVGDSSRMRAGLWQLEFGSMLDATTMRIMKTIAPGPHQHLMGVEFDGIRRVKKLKVQFPMTVVRGGWPEERQYQLEIDVAHLTTIYQTTAVQGKVAWVIPLSIPPRYFWRLAGDGEQASLQPYRRGADAWNRASHIVKDFFLPYNHPVAIHNDFDDPGFIDIGRWTTFRLVLSDARLAAGSINHRRLRAILEGLNCTFKDYAQLHLEHGGPVAWDFLRHRRAAELTRASALLQMSASPVAQLSFEVRYQLEVCLSRGILNDHTVTFAFLERLSALPPVDATCRLEYLVDQNIALPQPTLLFDNPDAASYIPSLKIPYYCALVRKAVVTPTTIRFNTPSVETSNRVVRKYNHLQDRFLRVQFLEEDERGPIAAQNEREDEVWQRIRRTLYEGIRIGDRLYEFLGFGSSQMRQRGAYFFCPTAHTSCEDVRRWMGQFSHIKVVAKYAARIGQCFSTTREIRGIFRPKILRIPDVRRGKDCYTDGVGKISRFLARLIIEEMNLDVFAEPTAFQFRMGGCKGVLAVWPEARGMEVHVRGSQVKFHAQFNRLEIVRCAGFSTATLNRQTITILECLGVPTSAFLKLLGQQILAYQTAVQSDSAAIGLLTRFVDESQSTLVLAELLKAGFRGSNHQDSFTTNLMSLWQAWSLKLLKEKARIEVPQSAFVMGIADETGTLRGHSAATELSRSKDVDSLPQIFLQLTDPARCDRTTILEGICIVGRNPSLHPGDIRVVEAVDNPRLHHLKDVVVFPSTGDRPVPSMLSGGDLDGDDFFVIWDPTLIPHEWNHPPMDYEGPKPAELGREVNVDDIRDFFVKYLRNDVLAFIAHAHLAFADMFGPKSTRCLGLAELHSKAVDYNKTGEPAEWNRSLNPQQWPHFMEKTGCSYPSKKALGLIYDHVVHSTVDFHPVVRFSFDDRVLQRFELEAEALQAARKLKKLYDVAVRRILDQHNLATEFELCTGWAMSRPTIGSDYKRQEDLRHLYKPLKWRFREMCYQAAGGSDADVLDKFVAAMYKVTVEEADGGAGAAASSDDPAGSARTVPLISFPWIFHWVLIRIATGAKAGSKGDLFAAARRQAYGLATSAMPERTAPESDPPGGLTAATEPAARPRADGTGSDESTTIAAEQSTPELKEGSELADEKGDPTDFDPGSGMDRLAALLGIEEPLDELEA